MSNRPNPAQFAQYSYLLAHISAGILGVAFLLALLPIASVKAFAGVMVWAVFLTGGIGAFMGYAAKADFKAQTAPPEIVHKARVGFRNNVIALAVTLFLAIASLGVALLTR